MCTEAEARQVLQDDRALALVSIVDDAWNAYLDEQRVRSDRTRANVVWDYMVSNADDRLAPMPGIQRVERYGIPIYVADGFLALRFKKHTPRLMTSNIPTGHQQSLSAQEPLPGIPGSVHLTCGYVLDAAQAGIEQLVAVKRVRGYVEWAIDLRELASGTMEPTAPVIPFPGPPPAALPGIAVEEGSANEDKDS